MQNFEQPFHNDTGGKSFQETFFHYLSYWKYIVASLTVCLIGAFLYLRYAPSQYLVSAKILIRDEQRGQSTADLEIFNDLGILSSSGNIDNELEILKSRTLMQRVSDSLNLNVSYFSDGRIQNTELHHNSPIEVHVEKYGEKKTSFFVSMQEDGRFLLKDNNASVSAYAGETVDTPWGRLRVSFTGVPGPYPVIVEIREHVKLPEPQIKTVNKNSGVVEISTLAACPEKSKDIINALIDYYNIQSIEDKRWATEQTIRFIDDRLRDISGQLETVEKDVESYKKANELTDIQSEAGLYLSSGSEYDKRITEIELQREILSSVEKALLDPANRNNPAPTNIGISDPSLIALMNKYNEMQFAHREMSATMTNENPRLIEMDKQITLLRNDILQGIRSSEQSYGTMLVNLRKREDSYSSKIRNLSTNEREFRGFLRQKEITETIFLYLLQKHEESAISLSMISPNAKVIDEAYIDPIPVKPRSMIVLLLAVVLGVAIPVGSIYVRDLLNNKIGSKEELEKLVKAPILGAVPKTKTDIVIKEGDRSRTVEMYRELAVNMSFMMQGERHKVVMITSSIPNEGKSSFSVNLALTLATSGKKVLLIDLDMRNSNMPELLKAKKPSKGMSVYLSDKSAAIADTIAPTQENPNMDIAYSGVFPPNPVELLLNGRLEEFLAYAREHYDYVVVDTPPLMMVSDALIVSRMTDLNIYVTRAGFTHRQNLKLSEDLYRNEKLKNMAYVISAVDSGGSYGYGYGYGYGEPGKKG